MSRFSEEELVWLAKKALEQAQYFDEDSKVEDALRSIVSPDGNPNTYRQRLIRAFLIFAGSIH